MKTKLSFRRQRAWLLSLLLVGVVLALPSSGVWPGLSVGDLSRESQAAMPRSQQALAPDVNAQIAAKILAAQLPLLLADGDHQVYLPLVFGPDDRFIMPMQATLPWGAVGFIDNGCTGVLIDSQHVLAAAHCFTYDFATPPNSVQQGDWQTPLTFFPNYHPDRQNPPRYRIDRVVVGTRVQTGDEYMASDWGIGHLAAPVSGFPSLAIAPAPASNYPFAVTFAGYARDSQFFPNHPYPQPAPGGYCPHFGPNCWWTPALVDPTCQALSDANDNIHLDDVSCTIVGGNSGSPILWNTSTAGQPVYGITGVIHGQGWAPGARRFLFAPRYAAGVALAAYDDGSARTQVFATDSDIGRVVSRFRQGTSVDDEFTPFRNLGAIPSPGRMAAFKLTNSKPQVVVISGNGNLYTSYVDSANHWQAWTILEKPAGVSAFLDVDAAYDVNGTNQLYVIGDNHLPYTRRRLSSAPYAGWGSWQPLASPGTRSYQRISAIRRADGTQQVFLVSTAGEVYSLWQTSATPASGWSAIVAFGGAGELPALSDLDAAWTESEQVQVFAVATNGELRARTMKTSSPADGWNAWEVWAMELFAPQAATPPVIEDIVSLTASRWQEETGGDIVPVVLATDKQGNIYYTTHATASGWEPWRSFYH